MNWFGRKRRSPPESVPVPAFVNPQVELEALGPVVRHNHVAYVPSKSFSGVPGVGTANLAYVPDFLLSAPEWVAGNAAARRPNSITIANRPAVIVAPKRTLEGIGGLTAGQMVHQPLLAVQIDNQGNTEVGE
ncbi:MAG TPA: hypothetical protein VGE93_03650 [Bryobacteraceae bacterium]